MFSRFPFRIPPSFRQTQCRPMIMARVQVPPTRTITGLGVSATLHSQIANHVSELCPQPDLVTLIRQHLNHSNHVLDVSLPYEPYPSSQRRADLDNEGSAVLMVAHWAQRNDEHKITLSSAFALEAPSPKPNEFLILTCAHTLEEMRLSPDLLPNSPFKSTTKTPASSGSFIVSRSKVENAVLHPVSSVVSSLPRRDLLLLSKTGQPLKTFPISPYPAQPNTAVSAHFVLDTPPDEPGWKPWIGGLWSKWVNGSVIGYRDFAGRVAHPGTHDPLAHLVFNPPPTPGSSGGPIIDESGAVIGIMLSAGMDSRAGSMRGWGVPSEAIFEMFCLPGMKGKC